MREAFKDGKLPYNFKIISCGHCGKDMYLMPNQLRELNAVRWFTPDNEEFAKDYGGKKELGKTILKWDGKKYYSAEEVRDEKWVKSNKPYDAKWAVCKCGGQRKRGYKECYYCHMESEYGIGREQAKEMSKIKDDQIDYTTLPEEELTEEKE